MKGQHCHGKVFLCSGKGRRLWGWRCTGCGTRGHDSAIWSVAFYRAYWHVKRMQREGLYGGQ